MNKIDRVFLDMDGVLNVGLPWFIHVMTGGAIGPMAIRDCPPCEHEDILKVTNDFRSQTRQPEIPSEDIFWKAFNARAWAGFPVSEECELIIDSAVRLVGVKNVFILSTPTKTGAEECLAGKIRWLEKHACFKPLLRQFLFGTPKWSVARPGSLLVDDYNKNVDEFTQHGGEAILVPRPWNRARRMAFNDEAPSALISRFDSYFNQQGKFNAAAQH